MKRGRPLVLAVAGFDPSGRAGLLADAWAIAQSGGAPLGVVTALTAQGARFVCAAVEPRRVRQQLDAALDSGPVAAVKLGMVPDRRTLAQIVAALSRGGVPVVIDPVVRTSKGQRLSSLDPRDYLRLGSQLQRAVLTPNRRELAWLGQSAAGLLELGFEGVIVKGSSSAVDEVASAAGQWVLRGARLPRSTLHHRGTGCRFGSGVAARLAHGEDLITAARSARRLVRKFLSGPILP